MGRLTFAPSAPASTLPRGGDQHHRRGKRIVRRIHILGGPGSGKTTLARMLAASLGAPAYDLDTVGYEQGAGAKLPLQRRLSDVEEIGRQHVWITEGIYLWWVETLLERADVIVWLDVPWRVAAWRIIRRHALATLAGKNRHRGLRRLWRFLQNARRYDLGPFIQPAAPDDDAAVTRAATVDVLRRQSGKVVQLRTSRDVERWLAG